MKMTTQEETLNSIGNNEEFTEFLFYLKNRWQDEQGLEDWKDYYKAMEEKFKKLFPMCSFCGAFKKPFGFSFEIPYTIYRYKVCSDRIKIFKLR